MEGGLRDNRLATAVRERLARRTGQESLTDGSLPSGVIINLVSLRSRYAVALQLLVDLLSKLIVENVVSPEPSELRVSWVDTTGSFPLAAIANRLRKVLTDIEGRVDTERLQQCASAVDKVRCFDLQGFKDIITSKDYNIESGTKHVVFVDNFNHLIKDGLSKSYTATQNEITQIMMTLRYIARKSNVLVFVICETLSTETKDMSINAAQSIAYTADLTLYVKPYKSDSANDACLDEIPEAGHNSDYCIPL